MKRKSLLLTAVATLGLTAATMAQIVPSYVPINGLVGWWPFSGNANDESGNGLNGIVTGATLTSDRNGITNSAYNFNFSNWSPGVGGDEIYIPFNSLLNSTNLTVAVWARRISDGYSGQQQTIINRFQFGYSNPYGEHWQVIAGGPSFTIQTQIIQSSGSTSYNLGPSLSLNNWTHIALTFDGISIKQFVNGILTDSIPANGLTLNTTSTSGISIGVSDQANGHWGPFDGKIDDIGIWNRALDSCEIKDLYFSSTGNCCSEDIITQPTNQTININNNVQFIAGSSDPNATYQWQTDLGVGFQNLNSVGQYSGATSNTLTVSNVTMSNNNQPFRCIIITGSCSDTSNVAILTVNNNVSINETYQANLFSVFPNPAQNIINVKADISLIGNSYSILDITGRIIQTGIIVTENTEISLNTLSEGTYVLKINEKLNQSFRILKN